MKRHKPFSYFLAILLILATGLSACGSPGQQQTTDDAKVTDHDSGEVDPDASMLRDGAVVPDGQVGMDAAVDASVDAEVNAPLEFNIIVRQTVQACSGCGIWFDWQGVQSQKPRLVVEFQHLGQSHTAEYQHGLNGMDNAHSFYMTQQNDGAKHSILIKQTPQRNGLFRADISDIPEAATIVSAALHLHIETDEGLAYSDHASVLAVHACATQWNWDYVTWTHYDNGLTWTQAGGDFGPLIREIRAQEDLVNRGFNKANPNAWFDFTPYVQQLQLAR
jgi:hypothetical protein